MLFFLTGCVGNKSNTDNMNESNVSTVENRNDKKTLVKQGIKIGDYVNYDATRGKGTGLSYTVDTKKTRRKGRGSIEEAETFNSSDITKWRVLSIKNGTIELVAEQPTSNSLE